MFNKSSEFYDLIYSNKDYKSEAASLSTILLSHNPDMNKILDAACGTAEHHRFLPDKFKLDGIDLNEDFIEIARAKNPKGVYSVADMTSFDLEKKYDAVICLFSSIGYTRTKSKLLLAIACFERHLADDGILLIEPWISPGNWNPGQIHMQTYSSPELKICRMTHTTTRDEMSILNFEYLVGKANGIFKFDERHELGLFDHDVMRSVFEECELHYEFIPNGLTERGIYKGTK